MRYKIGRNPVYRAPIPALIGGINTAASSAIVGDNQLSNCINMMAMDGILRTRPGFVTNDSGSGIEELQSTANKIKTYDFTVELNEKHGKLISVWCNDGNIKFYHCRSDGSIAFAGEIESEGTNIVNELTIVSSDALYSFLTVLVAGEEKYFIYKSSVVNSDYGEIFEWKKLTDDDIYVPTVMTNGRSDGIEDFGILSGSSLMGYNLINNKYSIEITAYNDMKIEPYHKAIYKLPFQVNFNSCVRIDYVNKSGEKKSTSIYVDKTWIYDERDTDVNDIESVSEEPYFTLLSDHQTLVIYKRKEEKTATDNAGNNIVTYAAPVIANVTDKIDWVYTDIAKEGQAAFLQDLIVLPGLNNIKVTAECFPGTVGTQTDNKKRVFSATCAAWYGGNRGLASGTRLFIGGMEGKYKNVLQWSDISNPLYFPENCNSEVGDPSSAITGFGKQADSLYIFKPNEVYAANYVFNEIQTDNSSLDLITDLTATTAIFPLTQISGNIGCDCPGTIQLCRNRLCWAHSNGKVYTLVSSSQYNEKNIYELTDPIRRALPNIDPSLLKEATSADWEGYYVLSVGEHIFLMQYESYGYSRIYSYTSEEAASHKLPWFYLKIPFNPYSVMNIGNQLILLSRYIHSEQTTIVLHRADRDSVSDSIVIVGDGTQVNTVPIPSMVQSKIFDFSRPEIKKTICHILAEVGGTGGNSIKLSAVTDRSRYEDTVEGEGNSPINLDDEFTLEGSNIFTPLPETLEREVMRISANAAKLINVKRLNAAAPGFFRMIRVNPCIFGVRKFAIRLESEGAFSLGQVCIEYKMLGSVD